ncbi:Smr/MutS family protein [Microbaculum marinum]|uniref:Smr/MutS family protein n=1 Tax=Microbaculum marinum TaxID=1764581 RepID=A0AAW9S1E8_9HYPH
MPIVPDGELWRKVTETVAPLKSRRKAHRTPETPEVSPDQAQGGELAAGDARPAAGQTAKAKASGKAAAAAKARRSGAHPPPPPLNPLDRRLTRRIGRGSRAVDAVIDLHGLTQREAHDRLLSFLQGARDRGHRVVLVVTGKGRPAAEGDLLETDWWQEGTRGVLRRAVPEWLATAPFRLLVVGYEQAHSRRGGEGAIYVQIRRKPRQGPGKGTGK